MKKKIKKSNMGIKKAECDVDFESVEKVAKNACETLSTTK
jgi:hypothetical protein